MADFNALRDKIRDTRQKLAAAEAELSHLRERRRSVVTALAELKRRFDAKSQADNNLRAKLEEDRADLDGSIKAKDVEVKNLRKTLGDLLTDFAVFADPTIGIERLGDDVPLLLFPLRLETRFKQVEQGGATLDQLWVRVYPDDCLIDTFDATLSETEVRNARRYWQERWRAGGDEAGLRAAWQNLVSAHGSGRAEWIERVYRPLNIAGEPKKAAAGDVVLVVPVEEPLPVGEVDRVEEFWIAIWLADGDVQKETVALAKLGQDVGDTRAAEIRAGYRPPNLGDDPPPPLKRSEVTVTVEQVVFLKDVPTKRQSWSRAPRADLLPNRLVLLAYQGATEVIRVVGEPVQTPLVVGMDPSAPKDEQMRFDDEGNLIVPDDMQWMYDFGLAEKLGMGFRVNLTPAQASQGFDRLFVLGVRLESDAGDGGTHLEELLNHHHFGRSGLALVPQGTPTNNVEGQGTNYSFVEDPDESFERLFRTPAQFDSPSDPLQKADGHWLAEWLGIDPRVFATVAHGRDSDQTDARAMNRVLWPATGDYFLRTMLHPVFSDDSLDHVRWFFTQFVSGRGPVPAIRIGRQPYGILPATAYSKIGWLEPGTIPPARQPFVEQLHAVLQELDAFWDGFSKGVSSIGTPAADPHQTLLDILGLHPNSAEFHFRFSSSFPYLYILNQYAGRAGEFFTWLDGTHYRDGLRDRLKALGYTGTPPDLFDHFFYASQGKLKGPLVDDPPASETEEIQALDPFGANYVEWLLKFAYSDFDVVRRQDGFKGDEPPRALLYLLLRHAIFLGYHGAAYRLFKEARDKNPGLMTVAQLEQLKREPPFVHLFPPTNDTQRSESRWWPLYQRTNLLGVIRTGFVHDFIAHLVRTHDGVFAAQLPLVADLDSQLQALKQLIPRPTAKLERALVEHLDCCTYRLDAWRLGLVHLQLSLMRYKQVEGKFAVARTGIFLGAYGWLENVRSENKVLTPKTLEGDLAEAFENVQPVFTDSTNGGHIHAPSNNHAVTAAVLRNGYLSKATPANHKTLQVNLSSERVRTALSFLEGMRQGQSLGALLGYQLERGLHDRQNVPNLDAIVYDLRKQFPLRANRFAGTKVEDEPVEKLEARNVIDGLLLLEQIRKSGVPTYPFGLAVSSQTPIKTPDTVPQLTGPQMDAINAEVDRLLNVHDALGDLALAEGVHQAAQGNFDRASAVLETFTVGNHPPEPSVVRTPSQAITLTHRIGVHLSPGLNAPANATPRAAAEPALNDWLGGLLPPFDRIACTVRWDDPIDATPNSRVVTLEDLDLQPLDLLQLLRLESDQSMSELDSRVLDVVHAEDNPRPDAALRIHYLDAVAVGFTFPDVSPLVRALASLAQQSRPLHAADVALQREATQAQAETSVVSRARIAAVRDALEQADDDLLAFLVTMKPLVDDPAGDPAAQRATILAGIDNFLSQAIDLLRGASGFGVPQSGWGFARLWKQERFATLAAQVGKLLVRWDDKADLHAALLAEFDNLPATASDDEGFEILQRAEQAVSTQLNPRPATPAELRPIVAAKGAAFQARLDAFEQARDADTTSLTAYRGGIEALLPVSIEDTEPFDLTASGDEIVRFAGDLYRVAVVVETELKRRRDAAQAQLDAHDTAGGAAAKVEALTAAARAMLGEDFVVVPEFTLGPAQAAEWDNAVADTDQLLEYLTDTRGADFPVDEWLYGVARVRPPMRLWEQVVMFAGAFGRPEPDLVPAQFPYRPDDTWLGLDYPKEYVIDRDRLLYTAHYATPFAAGGPQCGLLIDEWAEGVPVQDPETYDVAHDAKTHEVTHDTAISFHYDRPNTEAPQAWLLVTPAGWDGKWRWEEVVAALHETLDAARKRAVEPSQVEGPFAHLLPAVVLATTATEISISTYLARNNPAFKG